MCFIWWPSLHNNSQLQPFGISHHYIVCRSASLLTTRIGLLRPATLVIKWYIKIYHSMTRVAVSQKNCYHIQPFCDVRFRGPSSLVVNWFEDYLNLGQHFLIFRFTNRRLHKVSEEGKKIKIKFTFQQNLNIVLYITSWK